MTLRIILAGLVASMGFELPGGAEVSAWARSGRDWVHAGRLAPSGPVVDAGRPDARGADCRQAEASTPIEARAVVGAAQGPDDAAFLAASESMTAEFLADSSSDRDGRPPVEDAPMILSGGPTPPAGLPGGEELAEVPGADDAPGESTIEAGPDSPRAARVRSAVRLTREAVRAWSELIQESADEADLTL